MEQEKPQRLSLATDVFKALAHPARLRILGMLRSGPLCVCQITATLELAVSTVSAHLAELKRAGLVAEQKDGRWVRYSLVRDRDAAALLERVWAMVGDDPKVEADVRLVRALRTVSLEKLCRVALDVSRLGLRRGAPPAAGGSL